LFLRTLVAAKPGDLRRRILGILHETESLAESASSLAEIRSKLDRKPFDLVIVDQAFVPEFGAATVGELRGRGDPPELFVLAARDEGELRAELIAAGAFAVLFRELPEALFADALSTLAARHLEESRARLQTPPNEDYRLGDYVTVSPAMRRFLKQARRIAATDSSVLLLGETGVGKGLLARSLHNEGPRSDAPFIGMNCGALTETLLEAQLFGHERGAFTGADRARRGYFELAHGGTLFLDEIAEMPLHLQVRLLRVLEERKVRPLGAEKQIEIDVRLIAATNRDLPEEVTAGRFRKDLFYRLNVMTLTLPALAERKEDIPEIANSYVEHFRARMGSDVHGLTDEALQALSNYPWPGNIRELANAIERAVILAVGEQIALEDLPLDIQTTAAAPADALAEPDVSLAHADWLDRTWGDVRRQVLETAEQSYLVALIAATRGRVGETAARAGMDPRSLRQKMKKYGIRKEDYRS